MGWISWKCSDGGCAGGLLGTPPTGKKGDKQHRTEKLMQLRCDVTGCELSADPTGSPGPRRTIQRCPMRGLGLCTQTWLSLDAVPWAGCWDFAWSGSFRPGTIPGEELGEGSA